jgi:ABC-2 type transport system permease protein
MHTTATLDLSQPIPVGVPPRSALSDLRAIRIVWHREMLRFLNDKIRIFTALVQPMLYLFVFGSGMGSMVSFSRGMNFRIFLFPGVMAMAVLFTCFFSAGSLVWDREFGFMREMLVAPVRRGAIIVGKCLGGATVGAFQGLVVMLVGWIAGVPISPGLFFILLGELLILSFALTALALTFAVCIRNIQSFMAMAQMFLMPIFFLSGALFPLRNLPGWLTWATRLDPLTYAVDPVRRAVLGQLNGGLAASYAVTWKSWTVPIWLELVIVLAIGMAALMLATRLFGREE